jgi:ribokinase
VVVNRAEAAALADLPEDASGSALAETLHRRFGVAVVVTLGATGSVAATAGRTVPVTAVPTGHVVDTTGAGDSYVGTLAAALTRTGVDLAQAMASAAAAASRTVQHSGAQPPPPDPELTPASATW